MKDAPFKSGLAGEPGEFDRKPKRVEDIKIDPRAKARMRRVGWMERNNRATPAQVASQDRMVGEKPRFK